MSAKRLVLTSLLLLSAWPATSQAAAPSKTSFNCDTSTKSLQFAIDRAKAGAVLQVSGTCVGNFTIEKSITLQGPATLDGNGTGTVVTVQCNRRGNCPTVNLTSLTMTNGDASVGGGIVNRSILNLNGCTVQANNASTTGGGIQNAGFLTVTSSLVLSNEAAGDGGGIYNAPASTLSLTDSSVSLNTAGQDGGGIFNAGTVTTTGTTNITSNQSTRHGGGIYNTATVTVQGVSNVNDNTAGLNHNDQSGNGGGVYGASGSTLHVLQSASIDSNEAMANGGGVYVVSGSVNVEDDASVNGNTADTGGGIASIYGTVDLAGNASVDSNQGTQNAGGIYNFGGTLRLQSPLSYDGSGAPSVDSNSTEFGDGGGIHSVGNGAYLKIWANSTIRSNTADGNGGGIYVDGGEFNLFDSTTITGNAATNGQGGGVYHVNDDFAVQAGSVVITSNTPDNLYPSNPNYP